MKQNVRRLQAVVAVLAVTAALLLIYQRASSTAALEPQGKRQTQSRRRRAARLPAPAKTGRDYSLFKHDSHRGSLKCSDCHTITSKTEPDRISAATRPNIARGYPYHDSCFRCHRQQVYRGDRPVFCTVCHTRVSPHLAPRDVHARFPNPKRGDIIEIEFPGYFPHALHESRVECKDCHLADEREAVTLPVKGIEDDKTLLKIEAGTFKTIPGEGGQSAHAFCFKCHWEKSKPVEGEKGELTKVEKREITKDDCGGCHLSPADYKAGKNPVTGKELEIVQPPPFSPNAEKWFKDWPGDVPKRFSLKFRHQGAGHASERCNMCHRNIARMTTLYIPKADVQVSSCAECHSKEPIPLPLGESITLCGELKLKGESGADYVCIACHTISIGREQPPDSHLHISACEDSGPPSEE